MEGLCCITGHVYLLWLSIIQMLQINTALHNTSVPSADLLYASNDSDARNITLEELVPETPETGQITSHGPRDNHTQNRDKAEQENFTSGINVTEIPGTITNATSNEFVNASNNQAKGYTNESLSNHDSLDPNGSSLDPVTGAT